MSTNIIEVNETAYKANPKSPGRGVPYIYWINLGKNMSICPKNMYHLTNKLDGSGYTFHMTIKWGGAMDLVSDVLPTEYGDLGRIDYAGILGYPAFYPKSYNPWGLNIWKVNLEDICVKDSYGNKITNYSFIAADAEQTNLFPYGAESNTFQTKNGVWSLYDIVDVLKANQSWPFPGKLAYIGLGSNTVQELAVKEGYNNAPVFLCHSATECKITMISPRERQSVAVGVMIQEQGIKLTKSSSTNIIIRKKEFEFEFLIHFNALDSTDGYTEYRISDTLEKGLEVNLDNIKVMQTINNVTDTVKFNSIIINRTIDIVISASNITAGADVNILLPIKVINPLILPDKFFNIANMSLAGDEPSKNKIASSNKVELKVVKDPKQEEKPLPMPPENPNPAPKSNPNKLILPPFPPCCC